jgi:hypothetical protein
MDAHFYDDPQYAAYQGYDLNAMDPYYASASPVFVRQPV